MKSNKQEKKKLPRAKVFLKSRLLSRIIVYFILIATIPIMFLSGVSLYLIDLSHRQDVSNLELELIDQKIIQVNKFLSDTQGILEIRVAYEQISEIELSQQLFLLNGLLEENIAFQEVSFTSLNGIETTKVSRLQDKTELFDNSLLVKIKEALSGNSYVSDVYYTQTGPMVTMSAPVHNRNNIIVQILSADVNLIQLVNSIENDRLATQGYLLLLDSTGSLIAYGGQEDVASGIDLSSYGRVQKALAGETLNALHANDRYTSYFDSIPVVGAAKQIPELGWVIMVEWPLEDADSLIQAVRYQTIAFTFITVLIVLLVAPLFAYSIIKPIRILKNAAESIEKGNFDTPISIHTKDDLEELGDSFIKMSKGLKRLEELKNEFVFIAAHELRTPVTAINGYVSILIEDYHKKLPKKVKEILTTIQDSNNRLINLVSNILEIARSEAGQMKVKVIPTNLQDDVRAIISEVKSLSDEKQITIIYKPKKILPLVLGDSNRIKEVVMNFISNAIKYNHKGGWIKITHEVKDDVVITHIADNGIGLTEEEQTHLFQKFFRSETTKMTGIEGTGLGMFITKELIIKMKGHVWLSSEKGNGTIFSFSLPIANKE